MTGTIDYMEVLGILGAIAAKHPQTVGLLMNSYNSYKEVAGELDKVRSEFSATAKSATGPLDQAGILMQLAALHPDAVKFITQMLSNWQTRIPDLVQILNEFQAASSAAAKT